MKEQLNLYPLSYNGNKYVETKKHMSDFDISKYDIIAEPFGGIYGFSRAMFELNPNFNGKFIINDLDIDLIKAHVSIKADPIGVYNQYISIYNDYKDKPDIKLTEYIRGLNDPLLKLMTRSSMLHLYSIKNLKTKLNNLQKMSKSQLYKSFFDCCTFSNLDFMDFIDKVMKENKGKRILFYFDPPYFNSNNKQYICMNDNNTVDKHIKVIDNTQMYIDIIDMFKSGSCGILCVLSSNAIMDYLYKGYEYKEYYKIYNGNYKTANGNKKTQTVHKVFYKA